MEVLHKGSDFPQNGSLVLGFFDGVHLAHQSVIGAAEKSPVIVVTFSYSPIEYFGKHFEYIYDRSKNYSIMEMFNVDYVYEQDFSEIAHLHAEEYLNTLIRIFNPRMLCTGYNHTFGANRLGNSDFIKKMQLPFKYICVPACRYENELVSSTKIKEFLSSGNIELANKILTRNFTLKSKVVEGMKLGRKIGFPTANLEYPEKIVKIPYGVYMVKVFNKLAVMNWGVKPTVGASEILEVHIPDFNGDLYGLELEIEILKKIRDERKFSSIEELKMQIEKDIETCLK